MAHSTSLSCTSPPGPQTVLKTRMNRTNTVFGNGYMNMGRLMAHIALLLILFCMYYISPTEVCIDMSLLKIFILDCWFNSIQCLAFSFLHSDAFCFASCNEIQPLYRPLPTLPLLLHSLRDIFLTADSWVCHFCYAYYCWNSMKPSSESSLRHEQCRIFWLNSS